MDAVKEHNDIKVVAEFRNAQLGTNAPSAIQNAIAMFPELDGIVVTGASSGTMEAVIQTLDTEGMIGKIKHATLDIQPDTDVYLDEGSLTFIGGGQYPEGAFLAICCVNAVDGTIKLPVQIDSQFINVLGSEGYQDYITYIDAEGVFPWSGEEMQQFVSRFNPNATFQELYDAWKGYSMESVKARKGA
jgi:ABC-type sugar transport system substrate-binding protein